MKTKVAIVIPNLDGQDLLPACLESLNAQTLPATIIVVDNASVDDSVSFIQSKFAGVVVLKNSKNLGFAGGVNTGIRYAVENNFDYVALFNNDATAKPDWLKNLVDVLEKNQNCGIVTGKILQDGKDIIDNTGESMSIWGVPFARSRGQKADSKEPSSQVFGASGGSTLYRIKMFKQIGIFDEDFFAYYEDADINFRAQLAGWKVQYASNATVNHKIGGTSGRMGNFTTYQTLKNLPWLFIKNVPLGLMPKMLARFVLIYNLIYWRAIFSRRFLAALKAGLVSLFFMPKKLVQRWKIQSQKQVTNHYINSILSHELPPNSSLKKLAKFFGS